MFTSIALTALLAAIATKQSLAAPLNARGQFSGQATYYAVGLGACGHPNSDDEHVVAMNAPQFSGSCGKRITICTSEKCASAIVVDECPGCDRGDLDMSPSLFKIFNDLDVGVFQMSWSFGSGGGHTSDPDPKPKPKPKPKLKEPDHKPEHEPEHHDDDDDDNKSPTNKPTPEQKTPSDDSEPTPSSPPSSTPAAPTLGAGSQNNVPNPIANAQPNAAFSRRHLDRITYLFTSVLCLIVLYP
jgi:hypothetical protein